MASWLVGLLQEHVKEDIRRREVEVVETVARCLECGASGGNIGFV